MRKLIRNREKTKVLVFNIGIKNEQKEKWFWEREGIEEVKRFMNLEFVFNRNSGYKNA